MQGEKLSDAIQYEKLALLIKDFFGYIDRNTAKVDANLPVFYGYVVSALDQSFPDISDEKYDRFLDSITFRVLYTSKNAGDPEYVRRVMTSAARLRKNRDNDPGLGIAAGLSLLRTGDYTHALGFLKNHWSVDAKIGMAVAWCHYQLSLREDNADQQSPVRRPGEKELLARETMLALAGAHPPVNPASLPEIEDPSFLETIFWEMIFNGLEWFPSEQWFVEEGLRNAGLTHNQAMRKRLLDIGAARFYTDKNVLRELYAYRLENRDASGAAAMVSQLLQQFPDDPEPVFLGLRLSLLTTRKITYHSFRKLATTRGISDESLALFDISFDLLMQQKPEALARIDEFGTDFPDLRYYATTLRYLAHDFFSGDEVRIRRAKKTLLDSVEQYCNEEIRRRDLPPVPAKISPGDRASPEH
ncbi:MAG TPA: hypothetical protein VMT44_07390 [Methanoregula sp.]|nr:hypothetical protein [Methanoregula sp.]